MHCRGSRYPQRHSAPCSSRGRSGTSSYASLPAGTVPSGTLQKELETYLERWGPVNRVKLITEPHSGTLKCVFAEFPSEEAAAAVVRGVRRKPFGSSYLRFEPARGDRTLRFSLWRPNEMVNLDSIAIGSPLGALAPGHAPYMPTFPTRSHRIELTPALVEDLAQQYGSFELVRDVSSANAPCFDVVFAKREAAQQAYHELASLPSLSNLRVRWRNVNVAMQSLAQSLHSDIVLTKPSPHAHLMPAPPSDYSAAAAAQASAKLPVTIHAPSVLDQTTPFFNHIGLVPLPWVAPVVWNPAPELTTSSWIAAPSPETNESISHVGTQEPSDTQAWPPSKPLVQHAPALGTSATAPANTQSTIPTTCVARSLEPGRPFMGTSRAARKRRAIREAKAATAAALASDVDAQPVDAAPHDTWTFHLLSKAIDQCVSDAQSMCMVGSRLCPRHAPAVRARAMSTGKRLSETSPVSCPACAQRPRAPRLLHSRDPKQCPPVTWAKPPPLCTQQVQMGPYTFGNATFPACLPSSDLALPRESDKKRLFCCNVTDMEPPNRSVAWTQR